MRAVVQRVSQGKVEVNNEVVGKINKGLLILLGVERGDTKDDLKYIQDKVCNLRIFEDENEKMNLSLKDIDGELLIVPQFTLHGDARKGRRPSFINAEDPVKAEEFYEKLIENCNKTIRNVQSGKFGADMKVSLTNDGPVTILLDSKKIF
ncbi:D-aminoacyl-tRNA deacylase [Halanaerobium sp.]|jgi:D-tyrosyl-tRNA(Tyr) deacylase|uniref:D-aminoacyl-tRNA deacylase n=1 Tax=Halanaerobium sp. TaxID=1895664 RepID=UPI000DE7B22A|nr:D-aminoacyl-tRNA deacylase [Halanaerobium sp.]PUU94999.1 MAG: D-tyrosyl-tRNA(Tyr) deacylase [Halanaerobium sp.]